MDAFIRAIVNAAIGGIRDLAAAAMERILWLYSVVVAIGMAIRFAWNTVTSLGRYWRSQVFTFGVRLYGTLWYIIWVRIPSAVNNAVDVVIAYIVAIINDVEMRILVTIFIIRDWAIEQITRLLDYLDRITDWLIQRFAEVWHTLDWAAELVFMLLTSPERMAAWVFGALVRHLLMYLDENADSIGELIRRRSIHYAGIIAVRIEDVLVKLL